MGQTLFQERTAGEELSRAGAPAYFFRRACRSVPVGALGLSLIAALVARPGIAQGPLGEVLPPPQRLTVRPHAMAIALQTVRAGDFPVLHSRDFMVHVPPQCVGSRRCPLVVLFISGSSAMMYRAADKYGLLLLDLGLVNDPRPVLDTALKQTLQTFAVDPDKIAVLGYSRGCVHTVLIGGNNLDIFSRIVVASGAGSPSYPIATTVDPPNKTTEFLFDAGVSETNYFTLKAALDLRNAGHRVQQARGFRGHEFQWEDFDYIGRWLVDSWAAPAAATAHPVPLVVADSLPLLTSAALAQLTAFWTRFLQAPDSIRITARQALLREVALSLGDAPVSVMMVDMAALAARYPVVASALWQAGLTPQQHDRYRLALMSAVLHKSVTSDMAPELTAELARLATAKALAQTKLTPRQLEAYRVAFVKTNAAHPGNDFPFAALYQDSTTWARYFAAPPWYAGPLFKQLFPWQWAMTESVTGKNVAFLDNHKEALDLLEATGMWSMP